ncbi:MAG: (Fe-S)-binding protein [Promethearchaeati archaeon SRVP18_Atabeyarchaeia-1]
MSIAGKESATNVASGIEFIEQKIRSLNLLKGEPGEEKLLAELGKCLNCGICLSSCPVLEATSFDVFPGPRAMATTLSRVNPGFWNIKDLIYTCTECGSCQEICPEKVPVPAIISWLRAKVFRLRPDLIPESHKQMLKNLHEYGTSLPPEDEGLRTDLAESAMNDLDLPYKKDIYKASAKVAYFAGCLSTHRALEIRESGKLILEKLGLDFTLLKNETCCGLPASLIGDTDLANKLAATTIDKVKQLGAETIIATCSGCANTIQEAVARIAPSSGIRVKHLVEYLVEDVGTKKISDLARSKGGKKKESERIAIHSACHLSRHLSRRTQDYIIELTRVLPGVEITTTNTRQKCCGAGGLLSTYRADVSNEITNARLEEILKQGEAPTKIVAPCPTCVIQLGQAASNSSPAVKVEDLTVLLAKKIA